MNIHKINLDDNGSKITIADGDMIVIELPENPTTGYTWIPKNSKAEQITEKSNNYILTNTGIGSGGLRTFEFIMKKGEEGSIILENMQKWSNDVYQTFELKYTF
jgi:inhibitor of cysteine peptidase